MCRRVEGRTGRASLPRMWVFADAHICEATRCVRWLGRGKTRAHPGG
jgi:hypothetical protein